jgi:hypothetical protein
VEKTFDGRHPCSLCRAINSGKKSEKKTEFPLQLKKMEFVSEKFGFAFCPPQDFRLTMESSFSLHGLVNSPLIPPPRQLPG